MSKIYGAKKKKLMELDGQPYFVYDCSVGPEPQLEGEEKPKKPKKSKKEASK